MSSDGSQLKAYQFKKGQSGNPGGGFKESPEVKRFKHMSMSDFIDGLKHYGHMTVSELKATIKNPSITAMDRIFAKMVDQAGEGDDRARAELFNRLWGKARENVDMTQLVQAKLAMMSNEELIRLTMENVKALEEVKNEAVAAGDDK